MFKKRLYLDYASAVPVSGAALRAYSQALKTFGNPSAPHAEGRAARDVLENARIDIARLVEVKSDAVIFTSGATEANNLAIIGSVEARHAKGVPYEDIHVLYLPTAHASTIEPIRALEARGVRTEALTIANGAIAIEALSSALTENTVLVVIDAVCGESGTRWDTRVVANALRKAASHAYLHVDASQLPLVESFERTRLSADTMTLDAAKVGGVRGIGVLIASRSVELSPLMYGGGQERGLVPGTESAAHAAAFASALTEAVHKRSAFVAHATALRARLTKEIETLPETYVYTGKEMVPHILNVSFPGRDTDYLVALLDGRGIAVSTKSACETDSTGSRVLQILTGDTERALATLRISFGSKTSQNDIERFLKELRDAVAFLDTHRV